jgi:S1-C subfamily serine protease
MLLFLFSCVMPMLDTSDDMLIDSEDQLTYSISRLDRSIKSSVKLVIKSGPDEAGHASGNYFSHGRHKFIITAAHVTEAGEVWVKDGLDILKTEVLWVDHERDIAIVRPMGELFTIKPKKLRINRAKNKVGTIIRYAGYPADLGKMVLQGMVSQQDNDRVILQSFALPGSSGSIVFDEEGRAVGIPEMAENIVYAGRLDFIDRKFLKEVLEGE